jgi:competence protein ComGC
MKKILRKLRLEDGFTLLEMSIVILIVAALLLLIIPNVSKVNDTTDKTTGEAAVSTVETQKLLYEMDTGNKLDDDSLDSLVGEYITQSQLDAYNEHKNNE